MSDSTHNGFRGSGPTQAIALPFAADESPTRKVRCSPRALPSCAAVLAHYRLQLLAEINEAYERATHLFRGVARIQHRHMCIREVVRED